MNNPEQDDLELLQELDEAELDKAADAAKTDNEIEEAYANLSFRIVYQSYNYFLPQLKEMIEKREILNLRPEYQRRLRWTPSQKSLLIESLLLNIPIPPIFLYESELARYEVMDGQQRLNSIYDYLKNNFQLSGLSKLHFLNGKRYDKLPPKLKRGLDRSSISAIVLLQETRSDQTDPYLVRKYVFERLNTGGQKLNAQEIRNSIYRGLFNDMIVNLARDDNFCEIFNIPKYTKTDDSEYYENPERQKNYLYKTMADCQIVLRFFALLDDEGISGSMKRILDRCMESNSDISDKNVEQYTKKFKAILAACEKIFEGKAFLLPFENGRVRISVPLYDAVTVSLYRRFDRIDAYVASAPKIRSGVDNLVKTNRELIVGKANTASSIKERIGAVLNILDGIA